MCGISAIYGENAENMAPVLFKMLSKIEYRGDKQTKIKRLDKCILGCNRLAIVDREKAIQPMPNEKNSVFVVFNGEIYNSKDLRQKLEKKGHLFKTNSDTEVLIHGYEEWNNNLPQQLDGQFAFFIYDQEKKSFFAARDRFGIKPLHYAKNGKFYYFASEIKCFTDLDVSAVEYLPPGSYIKNGKINKYYTYSFSKQNFPRDISFIERKLRILIDKAVKKRVQTDLPVGIYFSGGIDSAIMLKIASKYHENVKALCVGKNGSTDLHFAQKFCSENAIELVKFSPSQNELNKNLEKYIYFGETFEPNQINTLGLSYYVANLAKKEGIKVVLAGEGADEIFGGYSEFKQIKDKRRLHSELLRYLKLLHRTQLQRVDRMSMANTVEVRLPYLDTDVVEFVMNLPVYLKIKKFRHEMITKWILRKSYSKLLPDYITWREKCPFPVGADLNRKEGEIDDYTKWALLHLNRKQFDRIKDKYKEYRLRRIEEAYYFVLFARWFLKARFNRKRIRMIQR